jgi:hypothetical protein
MNLSKAYKYKIMAGEEQFVWGESATVWRSFLRKNGELNEIIDISLVPFLKTEHFF